jgi:hypothetical protein
VPWNDVLGEDAALATDELLRRVTWRARHRPAARGVCHRQTISMIKINRVENVSRAVLSLYAHAQANSQAVGIDC